MIELPDVSILVALMDQLHVHHHVAMQWFNGASQSGWATCPLTRSGTVRVISRQQQPPSQNISIPEGAELLTQLIEANAAHHFFGGDTVSVIDEQEFDLSRLQGYRQITDLHLLGIALQNGGTLVTLDGGLRQTLNAVRRSTPHLLRVLGEP